MVANDYEVQYKCGQGTMLYLYRRAQTKADHTVFAFVVEDVAQEVKELKDKGVVFEEYDLPGVTDEEDDNDDPPGY